jgi:hypothetical protein
VSPPVLSLGGLSDGFMFWGRAVPLRPRLLTHSLFLPFAFSFKTWTKDAASASAALSAWSVADSGGTQDLMVSRQQAGLAGGEL